MAHKRKYWVGIDLGGTKMLTAILSKKFSIHASEKTKMEFNRGEKFFLNAFQAAVEEALEEAKVKNKEIGGIGIGCPGVIDVEKGVVLSSPNISFLKNYPLRKKIQRIFHVPVAIENDVNAGLYGEFQFGAARGHSNVVGIFPGTGVGGAFILNGKLYRGATGAAGEIGHTLIDPLGPLCGCGKHGCLEAFIGRLAIASEAAGLALKQQAPSLFKKMGTDVSKIKSNALAASIKAGDKKVRELIIFKARILGIAMANVVNTLNPELIVLGGGLVEAMKDLWVKESGRMMKELAMPAIVKHVKVVAAKLEDNAIVLGAAKLAQEAHF